MVCGMYILGIKAMLATLHFTFEEHWGPEMLHWGLNEEPALELQKPDILYAH